LTAPAAVAEARGVSTPRPQHRSPDLVLETGRLRLCLPKPEDAARVVDYYRTNRAFHAPWDPPRPEGFHEVRFWRMRLDANRQEYVADRSCRLFLFREDDPEGPVVGSANFTGFVRGPFQACRLGYGLGEAYQGQGFMTEALRAGLEHVFGTLGLHRVEANYVPTNERSGAVLRRLGFTVDGYARDYLFIDGAWRDHVLTSLTNPDAPLPPGA
jgi:ribosomal-protein-alanine N-acetyltransferase